MIINGKEIGATIFEDLRQRIEKLGFSPHLHIITLTDDASSRAYVGQKVKKGEEIGARITVENLSISTATDELVGKIKELNQDSSVHGIIVQRPMPDQINEESIANAIDPNKDVDGFHPDSKFSPPIAEAVLEILRKGVASAGDPHRVPAVSARTSDGGEARQNPEFIEWLKTKKIAVVGRGVTAGGPIIRTLEKFGAKPEVISSQTTNRKEILKNSDIVISAVGKSDVIKEKDLKQGVILIGVGMFRGVDGKFHSDYEEEDIKNIASYYTPTPGGVGPVNVAMLLSNLIKATEN